jgi:Spy/CpxP family protein refolding chaperone
LIEQNAEKLGLDEETVAAVRKLADDSRERDERRLAGTREAWERLRALLDQELPDEAALLEQAGIISKAGAEAHKQRLQTTLRVRALLTPEQRAQFMEIRRQARPPRPGGRGPGGGR